MLVPVVVLPGMLRVFRWLFVMVQGSGRMLLVDGSRM
jgi:hypothetical protein